MKCAIPGLTAALAVNNLLILKQEEAPMPHFVTLFRYTQQGITKIKESPKRLDAFQEGR